jgi:hypothetical protein
VASILLHWGDPGFAFAESFELDFTRTLYLLPYGVAVALAQLLPLAIAMRVLVFASVVAYPLGVLAVLRATGRPAWLALLALPFTYDRAFFWGFVNFELALGLALLAIAWLERDDGGPGRGLGLALLGVAITLTHVYGVALVAGWVLLGLVAGEARRFRARVPALLPLAAGGVAWLALSARAEGRGELLFAPLRTRLLGYEHAVFGDYAGPGDEILWAVSLAALAFFCLGNIPWSPRRWRAATGPVRVAFLLAALDFALYWVLPTHTETALFVHFRHGLLAVALLPLVASGAPLAARPRTARAVLATVALATAAIHGSHLVRFDREARGFDAVLAHIPERPRLCMLSWDRNGGVVRTSPYHHFHAYALAARGGVIDFSFPELFWNIPVRLRPDSGVPRVPAAWQWEPDHFDAERVGAFCDWVLVRRSRDGSGGPERLDRFPYRLVYAEPPWELYTRRAQAP